MTDRDDQTDQTLEADQTLEDLQVDQTDREQQWKNCQTWEISSFDESVSQWRSAVKEMLAHLKTSTIFIAKDVLTV